MPTRPPRAIGADPPSYADRRRTVLLRRSAFREDLATSGEIARLACVASEGGIGGKGRVPRPRVLRRDVDGELQAPRRAGAVERDELGECEATPKPASQLRDDRIDDALVGVPALWSRGAKRALPGSPLIERAL